MTRTLTIDDLEIADNYFEDNTSAFGSTAWIYLEFVCRGFNIHHNILNQSRSYYAHPRARRRLPGRGQPRASRTT